ncbi:hypothetical protein H4R35_002962 [Dimargaris xerosporica]|nr:hypothetical protein H4R35_002962 [Dimargaris xerosporica]
MPAGQGQGSQVISCSPASTELGDTSIGSYSSHGQFDSDDEIPTPTTPAEFYDPGYANAIRTQFAAQPNIHQLVDDLIAAYEAVEVPGVFPVAHYLQAILQANLWDTVGTASTKTVANSHALVLMRVIRLLISQAQEIDDGAAVRFLEQAHRVLRVVSQNFVQRQMDTLPDLYARRSATVAPADFLRGYIRQVSLGDGPTDNEALIQLADSLGGGTISPIHVVQFMNNIYARRGQELFENFQTPPAAHQ